MVETKTTKKVSEKLGQKGYNPRKTVELRQSEIRITSKEYGYNASKTVEIRKGYNPESSIRTRKPQQTTQKNSSSKNTEGKK